jgi:hypothetical protein
MRLRRLLEQRQPGELIILVDALRHHASGLLQFLGLDDIERELRTVPVIGLGSGTGTRRHGRAAPCRFHQRRRPAGEFDPNHAGRGLCHRLGRGNGAGDGESRGLVAAGRQPETVVLGFRQLEHLRSRRCSGSLRHYCHLGLGFRLRFQRAPLRVCPFRRILCPPLPPRMVAREHPFELRRDVAGENEHQRDQVEREEQRGRAEDAHRFHHQQVIDRVTQ